MLNIKSDRIAALVGGGLLAVVPVGILPEQAVGAQPVQTKLSEGIDENAIAQFCIIDNQAIATGNLTQEPQAYVSPSDGTVDLTVVNTSNSAISYLFPTSGYRELQPGESVTFNNWQIPNDIGIQQSDGGLTEVDRIVVSNNGESVRVELSSSPSFARSITGLSFRENGAVCIAS